MHSNEDWPHHGGRRERHERGGWGPSRGGAPDWSSRRGPGRKFWDAEESLRRARGKRGDVRAAALALLAEGPRNGYQIIQEIAERSDGAWRPSPGSVYPALQQLEDEGMIQAEEGEGGRKAFTLTEAGREYTAQHASEVDAPWDAVAGRERGGTREMRTLISQLAMAAMQVTSAGSDTQIAEAQRVLSETRRSLYRILAEEDTPAGGTATEDTPPGGDAGAN